MAGGVRRESLHHHFAAELAAPGSPGDLGQQLEGSLSGPKIGNVETDVGVENSDQGDFRKVKAFGDHLGADEQVDLFRLEGVQGVAQFVLPPHGVAVDPGDPGGPKEFFQGGFHPLGSVSASEIAVPLHSGQRRGATWA